MKGEPIRNNSMKRWGCQQKFLKLVQHLFGVGVIINSTNKVFKGVFQEGLLKPNDRTKKYAVFLSIFLVFSRLLSRNSLVDSYETTISWVFLNKRHNWIRSFPEFLVLFSKFSFAFFTDVFKFLNKIVYVTV